MRINVSEAYREEFEVFISKYQQFCDRMIDLVVDNVPIQKLKTYCRRKHPDVMMRLADTVSSSDIIRRISNKCSITDITPLKEVLEHYGITGGIGMIQGHQSLFEERMIGDYQCSLDEYLSKLRAGYLLGSSKDIVNAEEIIFILDWTPDDASFLHIKRLLYKTFDLLNKRIIVVKDTGKKILHLLNIYHNTVTFQLLHISCYGYFNMILCFQFYSHTCTHTHTTMSALIFIVALCGITISKLFLITRIIDGQGERR